MPSPFKRLLGWAGVNKQWKMANTELLLTSSGIIPQSQEAYNEMMSKHPQHQPQIRPRLPFLPLFHLIVGDITSYPIFS